METIENLAIIITLIWVWEQAISLPLSADYKDLKKWQRPLKWLLDYKPLNCAFCQSIWISFGLTYYYDNIIYLSLPLLYHVVITLIKKL